MAHACLHTRDERHNVNIHKTVKASSGFSMEKEDMRKSLVIRERPERY